MARIVVAGVARNCAQSIESELQTILQALSHHDVARVVIVESDSTDGSAEVLERWSWASESFSTVSLGSLANVYTHRTERLAHCRNVYMKYLEMYDFFGADYLFVSDLDGVNAKLEAPTLDRVLDWLHARPGAAATANQLYKYYDIWALRHPIWSPNDCWTSFHAMRPLIGDATAHKLCNESRMIHLPRAGVPIEVESAFGGGALYDASRLRGCRYEGLADGQEICEHVAFSRAYRAHGGSIHVHPDFINHDVSEHVSNAERFDSIGDSASIIGDD